VQLWWPLRGTAFTQLMHLSKTQIGFEWLGNDLEMTLLTLTVFDRLLVARIPNFQSLAAGERRSVRINVGRPSKLELTCWHPSCTWKGHNWHQVFEFEHKIAFTTTLKPRQIFHRVLLFLHMEPR
jgi:hypothetical protein